MGGFGLFQDPQNGPFLERFPPYNSQNPQNFSRALRAQSRIGGLIILSFLTNLGFGGLIEAGGFIINRTVNLLIFTKISGKLSGAINIYKILRIF